MRPSNLQKWQPEDFHPLYREVCTSVGGQQLAKLIDANVQALRTVSDLGQPALGALLPLLSEQLIEALRDDRLMTAFGHMVKLKLEMSGYFETRKRNVRWPFVERDSECAVFQTASP